MDPNSVKSTLSNLAFGNVMATAACDYQKDLLAQEKTQASSSINQEVDLDDLMGDPELEKLHADRIAAFKKEAEKREALKKHGHGVSSMAGATGNPSRWQFIWEAQSYVPALRLLLFDPETNPSIQCQDLEVNLDLPRSFLTVSWFQDQRVSHTVPIPRVLVDDESPLSCRAFDDHIEVKFVLVLPVDHPIVLNFESVLDISEDTESESFDASKSFFKESDKDNLSSSGGVDFYCKRCSFRLTKSPIRDFLEMPSVNWREIADNWFDACCCSFGGISEKMVVSYANAYACKRGLCLLSPATITLFKDDLVEYISSVCNELEMLKLEPGVVCENGLPKAKHDSENTFMYVEDATSKQGYSKYIAPYSECSGDESGNDVVHHLASPSGFSDCCDSSVSDHINHDCTHDLCESSRDNQNCTKIINMQAECKPFLDGFLGNIFMVRSSNLREDIEWFQYLCPQCSSLLGAYPCSNNHEPVDGGIRIFKCYVSTSLPVNGPGDFFRNYTLERMFAVQLLESATEESSFRTVVKDLKTKSSMLHIVVININSWYSSGYCLGVEGTTALFQNIDLHPIIKVLFSDCREGAESQISCMGSTDGIFFSRSRTLEDSVAKDLADEVFMFKHQIEELIEALTLRKAMSPPSCSSLEGLCFSSISR